MDKAQAAMEFLMTYGWAILIVIVAIGVLSYSGVLGGAFFLPEKCVISTGSGLHCEEFSASTGTIILRAKNVLPNSVEIHAASITQDGNLCNLTSVNGNTTFPVSIPSDSSADLILSEGSTCRALTAPGKKLKGDISITFAKKSLPRITKGDMITKIRGAEGGGYEDAAVGAPELGECDICDLANANCLCEGLDIGLGIPGYLADCVTHCGTCTTLDCLPDGPISQTCLEQQGTCDDGRCLGDELVTPCGDFTCNTGWISLPDTGFGWTWISVDGYAKYNQGFGEGRDNFSRSINIVAEDSYYVTIDVDDLTDKAVGSNELNFYLGGEKQNVFSNLSAEEDTIESYIITAQTTDGLFIEGQANTLALVFINSISVKEIMSGTCP